MAPEPTPEQKLVYFKDLLEEHGWTISTDPIQHGQKAGPKDGKQTPGHVTAMHTELRDAIRRGELSKRVTKSYQWKEGSAELDKARSIVSKYIKQRQELEEENPTAEPEATATQESSCAIVSFLEKLKT